MRALPLLLLATIALAAPRDGAPARPRSPRSLFLERCSACHDPGRVRHRRAGRDEWREIVDRMRRMPQSGISPEEARIILDYLAPRGAGAPAAPPPASDAWLSFLEIARIREGRVRLGGVDYGAEIRGAAVLLTHGSIRHLLEPGGSVRIDAWRVGRTRYEIHLLSCGEGTVARALKRA